MATRKNPEPTIYPRQEILDSRNIHKKDFGTAKAQWHETHRIQHTPLEISYVSFNMSFTASVKILENVVGLYPQSYTFLVQQKKELKGQKNELSRQSHHSKKLKKGYVHQSVLYQELEYRLQRRVNPSQHRVNGKRNLIVKFCE